MAASEGPPPQAPPPAGVPPGADLPPAGSYGPPGGYGLGLPPGVSHDAAWSPAAHRGSDSLAALSLVLGMLGIFSSWCCFGLLLAPIGVALGAVAVSRANADPQRAGRSLALVALAVNIMALLLWLLWQVLGLAIGFIGAHRP
jgi:hypothetical protein